jgi:hypothetical protein
MQPLYRGKRRKRKRRREAQNSHLVFPSPDLETDLEKGFLRCCGGSGGPVLPPVIIGEIGGEGKRALCYYGAISDSRGGCDAKSPGLEIASILKGEKRWSSPP